MMLQCHVQLLCTLCTELNLINIEQHFCLNSLGSKLSLVTEQQMGREGARWSQTQAPAVAFHISGNRETHHLN